MRSSRTRHCTSICWTLRWRIGTGEARAWDVRGLARFTRDFSDPLALCISRDPTRMLLDGVLCLHWRDALEELGLR